MKAALFCTLVIIAGTLNAAISFEAREHRPTGKHYTAKFNLTYHFYSSFSSEKVILLYFKAPDGRNVYKGLEVSKSLEVRLPPLVAKYIGLNIADVKMRETRSVEQVREAIRFAVTKALDQTWLDALKNDSESFSDRNLYKREYAGFDMNYYEFFPVEKNDLSNPTEVHDTSVLKIFTDSIFLSQKIVLENNKLISVVKDNLLKKPDFDKTISWQKYRYDNLMDVIEELKSISYHHRNLKISDWPQASSKQWGFAVTTPTGFHNDVDSTCKHILMLQQTLQQESLMPTMAWKQNYGNWKATRCNLFVGDFAKQTLGLPTYPWGTKDWRASDIHLNLPKLKDFVPLAWDKVWAYANLGYPVFITTPKIGPAGHIAIAFPVDEVTKNDIKDVANVLAKGKIVQAGGSNGLKSVSDGFGLDEAEFKAKATAYLYLGYLNYK
jgi:hypothetical protein